MKTPRVHDFDPNAKTPELASPLDNLPSIKPPIKKLLSSMQQELESADQKPDLQESVFFKQPEKTIPPNTRTVERPNVKRIITRNSFEVYEDQMESLRKLSFQDKLEGKLGSMSAMVREAIDTYLKKKVSEK